MVLKRATIIGVGGGGGSGLAQIYLKTRRGTRMLGADVNPLRSSLESAFGSVTKAKGKRIEYEESSYGTMIGFNPLPSKRRR